MIRNKKRAISNFFILLVLAAGISWVCGKFIHLGNVEYTDNAQVKQHLTPVSTRVQGFIKKICFEEYQTVKKGDTLAIIEDTEYESAIKLAEAALNLAKLNLSYTVILATTDGVTGRKDIHEGELVQPGQALVTLVDGTGKWVIANYKETQTTDMHRNQLVEVKVDAIPGVKFEGRIASISDATGASYSLIPQNNSAGNFVKVEQRIPVRIEFTQNNRPEDLQRLRAGMNVECYVKQ